MTVKIIDGSGKEIEMLIDHQSYSPGEHVVQYNSAKYKIGEHWYQITVEIGERNFIEAKLIQ